MNTKVIKSVQSSNSQTILEVLKSEKALSNSFQSFFQQHSIYDLFKALKYYSGHANSMSEENFVHLFYAMEISLELIANLNQVEHLKTDKSLLELIQSLGDDLSNGISLLRSIDDVIASGIMCDPPTEKIVLGAFRRSLFRYCATTRDWDVTNYFD